MEKLLELLDKMFSDAKNLKRLEEEWQKEFDDDPALFYLKYVQPVLRLEAVKAKRPDDGGD